VLTNNEDVKTTIKSEKEIESIYILRDYFNEECPRKAVESILGSKGLIGLVSEGGNVIRVMKKIKKVESNEVPSEVCKILGDVSVLMVEILLIKC